MSLNIPSGQLYASVKNNGQGHDELSIPSGMPPKSAVVASALVRDYLGSTGTTKTENITADVPLTYILKMYGDQIESHKVWRLMRSRFSLFSHMCFSEILSGENYEIFVKHIQNRTAWEDPEYSALSVLTRFAALAEDEILENGKQKLKGVNITGESWSVKTPLPAVDLYCKSFLGMVSKISPEGYSKALHEVIHIYRKFKYSFRVEETPLTTVNWEQSLSKYWMIVEVTNKRYDVLDLVTIS